jgi:hypothetical protein
LNPEAESPTPAGQLASETDTAALHAPAEMAGAGSESKTDQSAVTAATARVGQNEQTEIESSPARAITNTRECEAFLKQAGFGRKVRRAMASAWKSETSTEADDRDEADNEAESKSFAARLRTLAETFREPLGS